MSIIAVVFSQHNLSSVSGTRDPSHVDGTSIGCPGPIFSILFIFEQISRFFYFLNETSYFPIFCLG